MVEYMNFIVLQVSGIKTLYFALDNIKVSLGNGQQRLEPSIALSMMEENQQSSGASFSISFALSIDTICQEPRTTYYSLWDHLRSKAAYAILSSPQSPLMTTTHKSCEPLMEEPRTHHASRGPSHGPPSSDPRCCDPSDRNLALASSGSVHIFCISFEPRARGLALFDETWTAPC